jgi:hypothetical protein
LLASVPEGEDFSFEEVDPWWLKVSGKIDEIAKFHFLERRRLWGQGYPPPGGEESRPRGLLELAKRLRQPAGAVDGFFGFRGLVLFL